MGLKRILRPSRAVAFFAGLGLILLIARLLLPSFLLKKLNASLGDISPLYSLRIEDLDLHLWRMAYTFQQVHGRFKNNESEEFLLIPRLDVALAWRELFRGRFVADVDVRNLQMKVTTASIQAVSGYDPNKAKSEAKAAKDKAIPFDLERLRSFDSSFVFSDVAGLPPEQSFRLTHIDLLANNLTPKSAEALSLVSFSGDIQEDAQIKGIAQLRMKSEPSQWSVNVEMKNFSLPKLNGIATRMIPLSFKKGSLSLFFAAQSVQGKINGYAKPFLKDVAFIGDRKDFKTAGHFIFEIIGTLGNFFLKNSDTQALATKISFQKEPGGKMQTDTGKAIRLAIANGFGKPLTENLDDPLALE